MTISPDSVAVGSASNFRTIAGVVDHDGSIISGDGFGVEWLQTGIFLIGFDEPFTAIPAFVATALDASGDRVVAKVNQLTTYGVHVFLLGSPDPNSWADSSFTFIATLRAPTALGSG